MGLQPLFLLLDHGLYLSWGCLIRKNIDETLFVFWDVVTVHVVGDEVCLTTRLHLLFGIRNGVRVVVVLRRCGYQDTLVGQPNQVVHIIGQLLLVLKDLREGLGVY